MTLIFLLSVPLVSAGVSLAAWNKKVLKILFVAGAVFAAGAGWDLVFRPGGPAVRFAFGEDLMMDSLSALFVFLIVTLGCLSAFYAAGYLFKESAAPAAGHGAGIPLAKLRRYAFFFHLFLFSMLLTVLSNNLGIMWIAIEGTTLASAFLVNVDDKKSSIEAAWKYLILCTVGIALALFGIILVYYSAVSGLAGQEGNLLRWTVLLKDARMLDSETMKLAFVFILVGYGTKAGLAPFHSWLPDAHSQAPSPVSALLSGVLLSCATFGIVRFHILTQAATQSGFSASLLVFFGVLSVAVAAPFILMQRDYKRLFAYSSVEHMGLAAAGFGFGGALGIYGALLHIVNHAFNKSLLFFCAGHLLHQYQSKEIRKVQGIFRINPFLGVIFFMALLAIAGLPPFGVFTSEFLIFSGGFTAKRFAACAVFLLLLILIFAGFLKHGTAMTFGKAGASAHPEKSVLMNLVIAAGAVLILAVGIYVPEPLHQLIERAARVVQGGA